MWASRNRATAPAHSQTSTTPSQTPLQLTFNAIFGTTLGLGLAAFYILPAAYERRYVQIAMAIIPNMRIQDNFLFHHTGDALHDQVLHTASLIAVILLILTAVTLLLLFVTKHAPPSALNGASSIADGPSSSIPDGPIPGGPSFAPFAKGGLSRGSATAPAHLTRCQLLVPLTALTVAITLLLTPLTSIIWNHAPELAFLQFPWRLTAILAAVLSLTIALALAKLDLKPVLTATLTLVIAAALTYPAYAAFHQTCDEEDTVEARLTLFHSSQGAEPTDEYTPTTADNDSLAQNNPPYWLSPDPNAKATAHTTPGTAPTHLTVNAPAPEDLILNLRDYPLWRITLNGTTITDRLQREDGLIAIPIPTGPSTINITNVQSIDQTVGDAISLASLALLLFLLIRTGRKIPL
jgi:hypothetical protein